MSRMMIYLARESHLSTEADMDTENIHYVCTWCYSLHQDLFKNKSPFVIC